MGASWWNVGLDSVGETLYPQETLLWVEWPCWGALCTCVGHSYLSEGFCVPMRHSYPAEGSRVSTWDNYPAESVLCIHVGQLPCWACPVYPCGTQLPYWACPVYLRGRQLPCWGVLCAYMGHLSCWGVLCAHMGDSYPAEGGLRMHTCHSLIVILLLLQHGWIWAKNHFLKQPEDICIEDPPAEDVTEERNSNCSPHSKTGSQGRHRPIMCGSQWVLASATTSSWGSRVRFHIHAGVLGRAGHLVSMTSLAAMHPFQDSRFLSHLLWLVDQMARKGDCWLEASFGAWPRAHHWV